MNYALILAGGTGSRAGGPLPKQFQYVRGCRMLWWSVKAFKAFDPDCRIIMAVHPDFLRQWDNLFREEEKEMNIEIIKTEGGASRLESVWNALREIDSKCLERGEIKVFIHDAARPYISPLVIERGEKTVKPGVGAVPCVPLTDSIRRLTPGGSVAADRADFVAVQTPQVFYYEDIKAAYENLRKKDGTFNGTEESLTFRQLTDDASVAERYGLRIALYEGDPSNRKITNSSDFDI